MDRAAYVTLYQEGSLYVGRELDIVAPPWRKPSQDSRVEVMYYLETMGLHCIVVNDMDDNVLAERDIHYRPGSWMICASVEPHVHALVRHDDRKDRRILRA